MQMPTIQSQVLIVTKQLVLYLQRLGRYLRRNQVTLSLNFTKRKRRLNHLPRARPRALLRKQGQWVPHAHLQQESLNVINQLLPVQHHDREHRLQLVAVNQVLLLRLTLVLFVIFVKILDLFNVILQTGQQISVQALVRLVHTLVQQVHRVNRPQQRHHRVLGPTILLLKLILRSHLTVIIEIDVMIEIVTDEVIEMIVGTAGTIVMTVEEAIVTGTEITVMIDETGAK